MSADRYEVRLSGAGGQGMVLAGVILGEAACLYAGKNAVQSQSYGPEARGGASKSEVVISAGEIDYPKATSIDVMLALTQEAYDNYAQDLKNEGIMIVDSTAVKRVTKGNGKLYNLPLIEQTKKEIGKAFVTNIVALAALVEITKIITIENLTKAVLDRVPQGTEALNQQAIKLGQQLATNYH